MSHYKYQQRLKAIWTAAVEKYQSGHQSPEGFLEDATIAELTTFGLNVMDVFDCAEDYVHGGDPDFETFLMICEARRDYFLTVQKGKLSNERLDSSKLPPKNSEMRGIVWLPRIIPKALAKLKGELPSETMYCCGGDRHFFSIYDIHPAEFLRLAWAYEDEPEKIADWVQARKQSNA